MWACNAVMFCDFFVSSILDPGRLCLLACAVWKCGAKSRILQRDKATVTCCCGLKRKKGGLHSVSSGLMWLAQSGGLVSQAIKALTEELKSIFRFTCDLFSGLVFLAAPPNLQGNPGTESCVQQTYGLHPSVTQWQWSCP